MSSDKQSHTAEYNNAVSRGIDPEVMKRIEDAEQFRNCGIMDDEMKEFYKLHDRNGKEIGDLPDGVSVSTLLEPQETTSLNTVKGTYRAQFMQGNESEYEATMLALRAMCNGEAGSRIHAIDGCRRFAHFARDCVSGDVRVMTDSCRQRWCPMCAGQKAKYAKESTENYITDLKRPRFLTLTIRNEEGDLKPQMDFLQDSFRRLRQRAYWKKNVKGGIWFLQIKRSRSSGCWHPHFHILLDGNYMEQHKLSELWDQVTYGSPIIDIRQISDPSEAAKYVARYAARPAVLADLSVDDRIEIMTSLHGKRLSGTFGNAKCVTLTPPKVGDGGDWVHVGYYDKVVSDSTTNRSARAVLKAWQMNEPLADSDFMAYTDKDKEIPATFEVPKKPIQYYLDFYKSG